MEIDELCEIENGDLLVETCVTRNLSPALTLEEGLNKIKDEVDKLKLSPPTSSRGMYRFQVRIHCLILASGLVLVFAVPSGLVLVFNFAAS